MLMKFIFLASPGYQPSSVPETSADVPCDTLIVFAELQCKIVNETRIRNAIAWMDPDVPTMYAWGDVTPT